MEARLCRCHVEHHSNHDTDAWYIQISDQEEPAPSAPVLDNDDNDDVASDLEQASMTQKRHKTGITKRGQVRCEPRASGAQCQSKHM